MTASGDFTTAVELYRDMSARARVLVDEIAAFQEHVAAAAAVAATTATGSTTVRGRQVFISKFQREVLRDVNVLEKHGIGFREGGEGAGRHPRYGGAGAGGGGGHDRVVVNGHVDARGRETGQRHEEAEHGNEHDDNDEELEEENLMHKIRSSNISFHEAIWSKAKRSRGVVAFRKKVKFLPMELIDAENIKPGSEVGRYTPLGKASGFKPKSVRRDRKETITVDVIADDGATWVKVATTSERRMLMDLAKEGIIEHSDDDDDDDGGGEELKNVRTSNDVERRVSDDYAELKLIKTAEEYMAAARTARVRYQHPKVIIYLPHVRQGAIPEIDRVLNELKKTGVVVETAAHDHTSLTCGSYPGDDALETIFDRMLVDPVEKTPADTLNMDCTALIALISDISHCARDAIKIPDHYEEDGLDDIERQFKADIDTPLLPIDIYPLLRGRKLVCTAKTASHLRNIVKIMGSDQEKERTTLFLGLNQGKTRMERLEALQKLSIHEVPGDLQLPIQVVEFDLEPILTSQPADVDKRRRVVQLLCQNPKLSGLNRSVFFHGWLNGLTTLSLNRVFSEWIEREINHALNVLEQHGELDEDEDTDAFSGPDIVISGRERSLLGSEKPQNGGGRAAKST